MKILVISRTPWNNSNSFGNTFSNLFEGMPDVELYNICCQSGSTDNNLVQTTLQMSEASVIRALKGGEIAIEQNVFTDVNAELKVANTGRKQRKTWMFVARDLLWKVGALKWKKRVKNFIESIRPDVLYLPVYPSWYMCDIAQYAIKCASVPVIAHISDDDYGYNVGMSKSGYLYQMISRKKLRNIISKVSYIEVFADNMKQEYEKLFNVPCHVIGKGMLPEEVEKPQVPESRDELHFVYTGGIGGERFDVLMALARSFSSQSFKKCFLDIYSATPLTVSMKATMDSIKGIIFHGAVSGAEVRGIQMKADYLVHVEGFSPASISSTKMSFSTKIPDYLSTGNVMFAIGPAEINSIQVLKSRDIAVVCDSLDKIAPTVFRLCNGEIDTAAIQERAYTYLTTERNKAVIQAGMLDRLKKLL